MRPVSPVVPGHDLPEQVFGESQPEFENMPAHRTRAGELIVRWHCSVWDRLMILLTGDVYVWLDADGEAPQPTLLHTGKPF